MKLPRIDPRAIAGGGIFGLSLLVLVMLFIKPALGDSDLFKSLAQAIIMQGLVGLALAFYFTAQHRSGAKGTAEDPVHIEKDNPDA